LGAGKRKKKKKQTELEKKRENTTTLEHALQGPKRKAVDVLTITYFCVPSHLHGGRGREKLCNFSVVWFKKITTRCN